MNAFTARKARLWIEIIAVLVLLSFGVKALLQAYESPAVLGVASWTQTYVGLPEDKALKQAQDQHVPARVVMRNGKGLVVTQDFNEGRLNFSVVNGVVVDVQQY